MNIAIMFETDNFDFLDQVCPKRVFSLSNRKSEHHLRIQHIQINLDAKFHLKQKILIVLVKFAQKV